MKNQLKKILLALAALYICSSAYALPSGGQWVSDRVGRPEWVNENGLDKVNSVNMILCFINSFWVKDMVGQGSFKAKVNEGKCQNSADRYRDVIAQLSYDPSGPTVGNLWIFYDQGSDLQDHGEYYTTYVKVSVSESPSDSNPNGNLSATWNDVGAGGTLYSAGTMTASKDGFTMNSKWRDTGSSVYGYDRMYLTGTTDSATGAVRTDDVNGNVVTTTTSLIGVDSSTYCRQSPAVKCFSRSKSAAGAKRYSWRYGVYDAQGNRFDLPNPGFNVKGPDGVWGSANRWGIWSGSSVWANGSTVTQVSGQNIGKTYAYYSFPGRLEKSSPTGNYSTLVTPSSTALTLTCNYNCPTAVSIAAWNVSNSNSTPYPSIANTPQTYTYQDGVLKDQAGGVVTTSKSAKDRDGVWINLSSGGTNYWYNSGPNTWQRFTGLKDGSQFLTFSEPISFVYGPTGDTLAFDGFGTNFNIPNKVYLKSDGSEVDQNVVNWNETICNNGSLCQWVPNYLIDDQAITLNGTTYYVQWLQSELSPAYVGATIPSTITLGDSSKLPTGEPQSNIKDVIGAVPSLPATDPIKVIDGKLQ